MEYVGAGIRINAVCPGAVDAPILDRMTGDNEEIKNSFAQQLPVGRLCSQEDIAEAVLWLASECRVLRQRRRAWCWTAAGVLNPYILYDYQQFPLTSAK